MDTLLNRPREAKFDGYPAKPAAGYGRAARSSQEQPGAARRAARSSQEQPGEHRVQRCLYTGLVAFLAWLLACVFYSLSCLLVCLLACLFACLACLLVCLIACLFVCLLASLNMYSCYVASRRVCLFSLLAYFIV